MFKSEIMEDLKKDFVLFLINVVRSAGRRGGGWKLKHCVFKQI
jgi:hypothetical protein